jgi:hypothetical protein
MATVPKLVCLAGRLSQLLWSLSRAALEEELRHIGKQELTRLPPSSIMCALNVIF